MKGRGRLTGTLRPERAQAAVCPGPLRSAWRRGSPAEPPSALSPPRQRGHHRWPRAPGPRAWALLLVLLLLFQLCSPCIPRFSSLQRICFSPHFQKLPLFGISLQPSSQQLTASAVFPSGWRRRPLHGGAVAGFSFLAAVTSRRATPRWHNAAARWAKTDIQTGACTSSKLPTAKPQLPIACSPTCALPGLFSGGRSSPQITDWRQAKSGFSWGSISDGAFFTNGHLFEFLFPSGPRGGGPRKAGSGTSPGTSPRGRHRRRRPAQPSRQLLGPALLRSSSSSRRHPSPRRLVF